MRPGRIRLEANIVSTNLNIDPGTVAAAPTPVVIWPDSSAPTVRVVSVGGLTAPLDPKSPLFPPSEDITIVNTNSVAIVLQTSNFPTNGTVTVYLKSRMTYPQTLTAGYVSGDTSLATWQVITVLQPNYTVIQARAVSN
ncbi:MAG: hypothetical protein C5B50_12215 [Verrucomicrobia bacterium]|nr:MAG: hypothetical protein C5B50_12215 [Verrucomicrobiota bacterium]